MYQFSFLRQLFFKGRFKSILLQIIYQQRLELFEAKNLNLASSSKIKLFCVFLETWKKSLYFQKSSETNLKFSLFVQPRTRARDCSFKFRPLQTKRGKSEPHKHPLLMVSSSPRLPSYSNPRIFRGFTVWGLLRV